MICEDEGNTDKKRARASDRADLRGTNMTPTSISQLTEKLPPELLEKVLAYTPVPDILRMKQVARLHSRVQIFQLNPPGAALFARSTVISTILSSGRHTSSTESISSLQGWRITPL